MSFSTTTEVELEPSVAIPTASYPNATPAVKAMAHAGAAIASIPTFISFDAERQWLLEHLAGAFRVFGREGYAEGIAGHISVRDPEYKDRFWINPLDVHFSMMKVSDLICLDMSGNVVSGNRAVPANAAGVSIHTACHLARPDAHAICHAHSLYGKAWASFGRELDMLNQDVCYFYQAHSVYNSYGGIAFGSDEGTSIARALGGNKAAILVNHGLITVGQTVDEAAYLYTLLEKSCKIQLLVEAAGLAKKVISDEEAAATYQIASTPETLYIEFQPSYKLEEHHDPGFKSS